MPKKIENISKIPYSKTVIGVESLSTDQPTLDINPSDIPIVTTEQEAFQASFQQILLITQTYHLWGPGSYTPNEGIPRLLTNTDEQSVEALAYFEIPYLVVQPTHSCASRRCKVQQSSDG